MSEVSVGMQNYLSGLAMVLVLCGILAAVVWYGRKILGTLRASQEQIGALLKLSISDAVPEKSAKPGISFERAAVLHSFTDVPDLAPLPGLATALLPETESAGFAWGVIRWLRAPIYWNRPSGRIIRWLQAPVRS
jgi:hypothetical protein